MTGTNEDSTIVHENANYAVFISMVGREFSGQHHDHCYAIVNTTTHVTEAYEPTYPDAIHFAEHLNHAVVNKAWEWIQNIPKGDEPPVSSH